MDTLVFEDADGAAMTDAELRPVAALLTALDAEWAPDDPAVTIEHARFAMNTGDENVEKRRILALVGERAVARATVEFPLDHNTQVAELYLEIHPEFRRRGVGTALLRHAVTLARGRGRTSLACWGPRTDGSLAFWERYGIPEVLVDRTSRADIEQIDEGLMERWRTDCSARRAGYVLHSWVGPCPEGLMPLYVDALQGLRDAPLDDLDMEQPPFDEGWNRSREESIGRRGGLIRVICAASPAGEAAGVTEVTIWDHSPHIVQQQGTTTLPRHRNRGIGRWLKAEMYGLIRRHHRDARVIETGNANSNASMLSINTEMGFRLHMPLTTRQADLADIERALDRDEDRQRALS